MNLLRPLRTQAERTLYLASASWLLAALVVAGCGEPNAQAPAQMPPPEVNVITVAPRTIPLSLEYVGQTEGVREVEVRSRVTGILQRWNFTEGASVKAGQSLFTIDPAPFRAAVARADAELASALARHAQTVRDIERLRPLQEQGMVSKKAFDDAIAAEQVAAASIKAARAVLTQAKLDLEYTRVEAPISGVTSRALKSEGSLVEAQQTLLTTISQIDPLHVIFGVPESEHLKLGTESAAGRLRLPKDGRYGVTVRLSDGTVYARSGKVDFTDVRVNPGTGSSEVRAVLPNPDQRLRPGQFVRVTLNGAEYPEAIAVPQRAVLEGPQGKMVFVVDEKGTAQPRPVQVGDWAGEEWVIDSGLQAGDQVIVDGVMKIRPGVPVKIAEAPPPGSTPDTAAQVPASKPQ